MSREAEILLAIDEFAAALARFRAEVAALIPPAAVNGAGSEGADDPAEVLLDTTSAAARWGLARDTVAKMCREVDGIGVWKGDGPGSWRLASDDVRPPEEWRRRKLPLRCTVCGREMPGEHWRRRRCRQCGGR